MLNIRLRWVLILAAGLALALATGALGQDYVGAKLCKGCHTGMHKAIVEGYEKIAHPKALQDAAGNPAAVVATFDASAPIKKEQIKYVLGKGRGFQAYIGADMKTLPAEWCVTDKKWVTTTSVDAKTQCIGCHVTGYNPTTGNFKEGGVGCERCHGPGSAHVSTMDKTKIVNPKKLAPDKVAMICGQCHSKGTDTTKTYAFPINFKPGGDLAAAFIDANPTTAGRNQQYSEWKNSKHATVGTNCVICHEPHGAGTTEPYQLRKPIVDTCMGCHKDKDMKTHSPSAPAGATCATCHMPNGRHTFAKPGA